MRPLAHHRWKPRGHRQTLRRTSRVGRKSQLYLLKVVSGKQLCSLVMPEVLPMHFTHGLHGSKPLLHNEDSLKEEHCDHLRIFYSTDAQRSLRYRATTKKDLKLLETKISTDLPCTQDLTCWSGLVLPFQRWKRNNCITIKTSLEY